MIQTRLKPGIAFVFIILIMAVIGFSVSNSNNITGNAQMNALYPQSKELFAPDDEIQSYTVQQGQSLWTISRDTLAADLDVAPDELTNAQITDQMNRIIELNPELEDVNIVQPNQQIDVPLESTASSVLSMVNNQFEDGNSWSDFSSVQQAQMEKYGIGEQEYNNIIEEQTLIIEPSDDFSTIIFSPADGYQFANDNDGDFTVVSEDEAGSTATIFDDNKNYVLITDGNNDAFIEQGAAVPPGYSIDTSYGVSTGKELKDNSGQGYAIDPTEVGLYDYSTTYLIGDNVKHQDGSQGTVTGSDAQGDPIVTWDDGRTAAFSSDTPYLTKTKSSLDLPPIENLGSANPTTFDDNTNYVLITDGTNDAFIEQGAAVPSGYSIDENYGVSTGKELKDNSGQGYAIDPLEIGLYNPSSPASTGTTAQEQYRTQATQYMNQAEVATTPAEKARLYGLAADAAQNAGDTQEAASLRQFQTEVLKTSTAPAGSQASAISQWEHEFGTGGSITTATSALGTKTESQQAQERLIGINNFLNTQKHADGTALTPQEREAAFQSLANSVSSTNDPSSNELAALLYEQMAKTSTNPAQQATYYDNAAAQWGKGNQNPTRQASAYANAYDARVANINNNPGLSRSEKNAEIERLATEYSNKIGTSDDEKTQQDLQAAKNRIDNERYLNTPPAWMDTTYNFLNDVNGYLDGYKGASFFYTDDGFVYDQLDENMQDALSGIEGWSSIICKSDVVGDINGNNGYAFSSSTSGASAHIEGEKITVTNYTDPSAPTSTYYYKVSFEVSPGTASVGCNMKFKAYLGKGTTPLVVQNGSTSAYQWSLEGGDSAISYTGTSMIVKNSDSTYTEACLLFDEISSKAGTQGCMIGISEGDYLCKKITIGVEQTYNNFNCNWCDSVGSIFGSGGGGTRTSTTTGSTSTANGGATVNPNI